MKRIYLKDVTLTGVDCIDVDRLIFAADICQKNIRFGQTKLLSSLPHTNKQVYNIDPITSIEDYSNFIIKELYKFIETKYVLIIQWDGFILNPLNWSNSFLDYDYIGAPWWYDDEFNVGNGGFSLRSKKLMRHLALDRNIKDYHPEDHVICRTYGEHLKNCGFKFAGMEIAAKFSIETQGKWENQFGFHKCDISDWDIHKFADTKKHQKYIDLFNAYFGK